MSEHFPNTQEVFRRIKDNGFSPKSIVDVGAYEGTWALEAHMSFPAAWIFMVEANPLKIPFLEAMSKKLVKAYFEIAVLSDREAERTFYVMDNASSLYSENTSFSRTVETRTTNRLDSLYNAPCDFLKVDVQGAELDVLRGYRFLQDVQLVMLETSLLEYNQGAPLFHEAISFMRNKGFVVYDFCESFRRVDGTLFQIDTLFVPENSPLRAKKPFWRLG